MMRDVHLHGALADKYGPLHRLDVDSPSEAVRALIATRPGFRKDLEQGVYQVSRGPLERGRHLPLKALGCRMSRDVEVHITPVAATSGLELPIWAIIGLTLVAAVTLAVVLMPKIKTPDANDRERNDRNSFVFDGPVNVTEQGHPVPIILGECIVGSIVGSAGVSVYSIAAPTLPGQSTPGFVDSPYGNDLVLYKGGKGGSSSYSTATESPNTLQSTALARVLDIIGEGEIVGLVDGLKSVYFDKTPVQNSDDSFNFKGVSMEQRVGLMDQPYMQGHEAQETPRVVDQIVDNTHGAVTETIINADANLARVIVRTPSFNLQDTTTGNLTDTSVSLAIDMQSNGGGFTEVFTDTFTGKCTAPYQREYVIPLPAGQHPWDIRVRRVSPDTTEANIQDDIYFDTLTEVVEAKLTYPGTALIGLTIDASQFGSNVPQRGYHVKGLICEVPTNYDPENRIYTGVWDGTFKRAYTNNPAWQFRELCVRKRFGLGDRLTSGQVDKWALYSISQYNDGLVPDGNRGFEPRYTVNTVINTLEDAYKVLNTLCSAFRSLPYWGSGAVTLSQDAPQDPAFLVTPSNVEDGMFDYSSADYNGMYSAVRVSWNDPEDLYRQAIEVVEDPVLRAKLGWRATDIVAWGATSRGRAIRWGRDFLEDQNFDQEQVKYTAGRDHARGAPGDVASIHDPEFTLNSMGGRVAAITDTSHLRLDRDVVLSSGFTYTLTTVLPTGELESRIVANSAGTTRDIILGAPFTAAPVRGAVWQLQSDEVAPRLWRLRSAIPGEDKGYEITASLHDPGRYARVEREIVEPATPFTNLPRGALESPSGLAVTEFSTGFGDAAEQRASLGWTKPTDARVIGFQAQLQRPGSQSWEYLTERTTVLTAEARNVTPGSHSFRVRSFDALGRYSPWRQLTQTLVGLPPTPPDVEQFDAYPGIDYVIFKWTPVDTRENVVYEIRQGLSWELGTPVTENATGDTVTIRWPVLQDTEETFMIKARSARAAIYSDNPRFAIVKLVVSNSRNVIQTIDLSALSWPGVVRGFEENGTAPVGHLDILFDGATRYRYGDYTAKIALDQEFFARNWATFEYGILSTPTYAWDDAPYPWTGAEFPWVPSIILTQDANCTVKIAVDQAPPELVDGWLLQDDFVSYVNSYAGDAVGFDGDPVVVKHTYTRKFEQPARLNLPITLEPPFTVSFDYRFTGGTAIGVICQLRGVAPGDWMLVRNTGTELQLEDSVNGVTHTIPGDFLKNDRVIWTITIVQGADFRTLHLYKLYDPLTESVDESWVLTTAHAPMSDIDRVHIGGKSRTWAECTLPWEDITGSWYSQGEGFPQGAVANITLLNQALRSSLDDNALNRGPVGYSRFKLLAPGDYQYETAYVWARLSAPPDSGLLTLKELDIHIDVPDVFDGPPSGEGTALTAGLNTVYFNRRFYEVPEVTPSWIGGSTPAQARLVATYKDRFIVDLPTIADHLTTTDGTISWIARGRGP